MKEIVGVFTLVLVGVGLIILLTSIPVFSQKSLDYHLHAKLTVMMNGKIIIIPPDIGNRELGVHMWGGRGLDRYSPSPGLSPIHTHYYNGVVHLESTVFKRFTFGDFLNVWGINQTLIVKVLSNGENTANYQSIPLTNTTNITLYIKPAETTPKNFTDYVDSTSGLSFQYPSEWHRYKAPDPSSALFNQTALRETFIEKIYLFPSEWNYLENPIFTIEEAKLPSDKVTLDQYTIAKLAETLEGNENRLVRVTESVPYNLNGNAAQQFALDNITRQSPFYDYHYPGYFNIEKVMQIWTIRNDKAYIISYMAYPYDYSDYLPTIERILKSIKLD